MCTKVQNIFRSTMMKKYICDVCGYVYDESTEVMPFKDLPIDWTCPKCGVDKDQFSPEE